MGLVNRFGCHCDVWEYYSSASFSAWVMYSIAEGRGNQCSGAGTASFGGNPVTTLEFKIR
jgi:hypothetical protein